MKKHREKGIKTFFGPLISSYPDDKVPYPLVSYGENKKKRRISDYQQTRKSYFAKTRNLFT